MAPARLPLRKARVRAQLASEWCSLLTRLSYLPPASHSLVRKTLLVPPPMPEDKRRALSRKGGERLPLPDIGPRARPSSRFTLVGVGVMNWPGSVSRLHPRLRCANAKQLAPPSLACRLGSGHDRAWENECLHILPTLRVHHSTVFPSRC